MAEQVQIEVTTTTVKHTVISGEWHFYTSTENKPVPSSQPAPKGK